MPETPNELIISTDIPGRLDRLAWAGWHTQLTIILGIGWLLDALETTYNSMTLQTLGNTFNVSDYALTYINFAWMIGALCGALTFGTLSDHFGRRWVFLATISSYTVCTLTNVIYPNYWMMLVFRFMSGFGIGGENASVHTVIQEFIPARHRGKVSVLVSASWDLTATATSYMASVLTSYVSPAWSWRVGMLAGGALGCVSFMIRLTIPESPRWLLSRHRKEEAEAAIKQVEARCKQSFTSFVLPMEDVLVKSRLNPTHPLTALKFLWKVHWLRLIYSAGLNAVLNFSSYGYAGYAQLSLFPSCGITESATSLIYVAATGVNAISNPLFAFLLDRVGRKRLIPLLYLATATCAAGFFSAGKTCQYKALLVVSICWKFFEAPAANCAITAGTEVFPTELLSIGNGLSHAVGRLFAAASQTILVSIFNSGSGHQVNATVGLLIASYGAALAICAVWYVHGFEGAAVPLEAMGKSQLKDCERAVVGIPNKVPKIVERQVDEGSELVLNLKKPSLSEIAKNELMAGAESLSRLSINTASEATSTVVNCDLPEASLSKRIFL